jgi:hypothetical protein
MKIKEYALTGLVIMLIFALGISNIKIIKSQKEVLKSQKEVASCRNDYSDYALKVSEEKRELQSEILTKKQQTYVNKKIRATIPVNDKLEFLRQHAIPTNIGAK